MLKKDLILNKIRCLLNEFINPIIEKADKPRKKMFCQAIGCFAVGGVNISSTNLYPASVGMSVLLCG